MTAPTAAAVRGWSRIDFGALGYGDNAKLGVLVARANTWLETITGLTFAGMPTAFEPLAEQAIQMLVEQMAYQSQEDIIETAADFHLIASFSAGDYSETRRGMDELRKSGMLNSDPAIHMLLWRLLTPDKQDEWLGWINGTDLPAFEVTEVDWSAGYGQGYESLDNPPRYYTPGT